MERLVAVLLLNMLGMPPLLSAASNAEIFGTVRDAVSGEPLAHVAVRVHGATYQAESDTAGHFSIPNVTSGSYMLQASTVGYRTVSTHLDLIPGARQEVQFALSPDTFRRVETVAVQSGTPFDASGEGIAGQFTLVGSDMNNLTTVLADDPLRAVQAVPGVASDDDFDARFTLRGADPERVGIYVDGVQLHQAVHTLEGVTTSGSNSIFNADLISELNLFNGAPPPYYADNSAGVLDVTMRDGNRDDYSFRATANFAYGGIMAEGPLAKRSGCSWIAGFRKSYLQYLLQNMLTDPSMSFGFQDAQGRLVCQVSPASLVTLDLLNGDTGLDLSSQRDALGPNALMLSRQKFNTANLGWRYIASDNFVITNHVAWLSDSFSDQNLIPAPLGSGNYREWTGNTQASWAWTTNSPLDVGFSMRSMADAGYLEQYNSLTTIQLLDQYRGSGALMGSYVNQSWTTANGRLHIRAGGRWDRSSVDGVNSFSPQAGLTFSPWASGQIELGWGQFVQYPDISQFFSNLGGAGLLPLRSTQANAAIEQRFTARLRVRATFYDRQDRDLLDQPWREPRLIDGVVYVPPLNPLYENSLRGYGRGFELLLQRTSANRLNGWVSYAYGHANMRDGVTGETFPSDYDQRHTINAYGSYRIRPSINLSARWTYGSGFPVPAYVAYQEPYSYSWANVFALGSQRNAVRLPAYRRLDLRISKSWTHTNWKTSLYGEVINVTNSANYRYDNFEAYNPASGLAYITLDKMFPVLPSIGVVFER